MKTIEKTTNVNSQAVKKINCDGLLVGRLLKNIDINGALKKTIAIQSSLQTDHRQSLSPLILDVEKFFKSSGLYSTSLVTF